MRLLCLMQGLTSDVLLVMTKQVVFAMEELIRIGKIYFPTLNTSSDEFMDFREMVDSSAKYDDILNMIDAFKAWRGDNIVRACLDTIAIGKLDDLRLISVARPGVDIDMTCVSFCQIL